MNINIGDQVATFDPETDEQLDCTVLEIFELGGEQWALLNHHGNQFETTTDNLTRL